MADLKEKILAVLRQRRVASLATVTPDGAPWVRYVVPQVDDDLTLLVPTHARSRKVAHLRANPEVHLTTGVSNMETARHYVQVQGTAEVLDDADAKEAAWRPHLASYFKGADDPDYVLLRIRPYRIEYVSADSWSPEIWTAA